ncbi:hypothetical protein [Emticicia sp. SJ17W-69]|uniref:hypothetical protein n=1 Tax=Emticicia sp. SJ17W-69 TaxID=3421657 RepID=UPI003EBD0EC5
MKKLFVMFFAVLLSTQTFAQTAALKQQTDWLTSQLNKLVIDDDNRKMNVNDHKSKPTFSFVGSKMLMNLTAKEENFSMGVNISWLLKDVRKVSYQKQKDGNYKLVLDVPADRIKMDLGFGKDNTIGGSFNVNDKDDKDPTSFTLSTKDETLVKEMVQQFEGAVREARK